MTPLQIEMNKLTDMEWGWWPFLGLRPKKEAVMNTRLLLKITALFGSLSGALGLFIIHLRYDDVSLIGAGLAVVSAYLGFFFGYRFTFARAWNARAAELNRQPNIDIC